jgi:DNA-binding NtrC family response regulator
MVEKILVAWIGVTDLRASRGDLGENLGPLGQAVEARSYTEVHLLSDHPVQGSAGFSNWLSGRTQARVQVHPWNLSGPTQFDEIYQAAMSTIDAVHRGVRGKAEFTYHLSPGTPAMAAVWILLAKTSRPAELIESSPEKGVRTVAFPFELSADYLPDLTARQGEEIARLTQGLPSDAPAFENIIHRCAAMKRVVAQARRLAVHDVPVMLQGESGTGKELFARAIHACSPRHEGLFVPVNCGAIPPELVESEFFGHVKGAFTGAVEDREGHFEAASGGTLFLDEIGELPLPAQVKLLRTLQDRKVQRIGGKKLIEVNIRVIAATNRNIVEEVAAGRFREDLYYRLAVGVLRLPPVRERPGDLNLLIDDLLARFNMECRRSPPGKDKRLSAGARNLLHQHPWPGNIRELANTLSRAAIWTPDETIQVEDIREALFPVGTAGAIASEILNRPLGNGLDLNEVLAEVARHYLERAWEEAAGNKTEAAKLVGLASYQTYSNWLTRYGIDV